MAKIEDFEKRYVAHVDFREGDVILVTKENIEQLRNLLKNTNFHCVTGSHILDSDVFDINRVICLYRRCTSSKPVYNVRNDTFNGVKAINYIFIEC